MIYDFISLTILLCFVMPLVLYSQSGQKKHIKAFFGLIFILLFSEFLKRYIIREKSVRPSDAYNCNTFCNDGKVGGKAGMPSSHSAVVWFFIGFYFSDLENSMKSISIIFGILMILSRYYKKCHTISQIVAGSLLGLSSGLLLKCAI